MQVWDPSSVIRVSRILASDGAGPTIASNHAAGTRCGGRTFKVNDAKSLGGADVYKMPARILEARRLLSCLGLSAISFSSSFFVSISLRGRQWPPLSKAWFPSDALTLIFMASDRAPTPYRWSSPPASWVRPIPRSRRGGWELASSPWIGGR